MHRRIIASISAMACGALLSCGAPQASPSSGGQSPELPPLPRGTLYLLAGSDPSSANIYVWSQGSRKLVQRTHNPAQYGISWLNASAAGVADDNAASGTDVVEFRHADTVTALKDQHLDRYFGPSVANDGTVSYIDLHYASQSAAKPESYAIIERPRAFAGAVTRVFSQSLPSLGAASLSASGELAFVSSSTSSGREVDQLHIVHRGSTGSGIVTTAMISGISQINWSSDSSWLSATNSSGQSLLYNVSTGKQFLVAQGWDALCWEPARERFIVQLGTKLGLVEATEPAKVSTFATLPGTTTYQCTWLKGGPSD